MERHRPKLMQWKLGSNSLDSDRKLLPSFERWVLVNYPSNMCCYNYIILCCLPCRKFCWYNQNIIPPQLTSWTRLSRRHYCCLQWCLAFKFCVPLKKLSHETALVNGNLSSWNLMKLNLHVLIRSMRLHSTDTDHYNTEQLIWVCFCGW